MPPTKAIRAKCLDCCGGHASAVKLCPCEKCPLHPFRLGKNPNRAGITNEGTFPLKNDGSTNDLENVELLEGAYTIQEENGEEVARNAE